MPHSSARIARLGLVALGLLAAGGCGDQIVGSFDPTEDPATGSLTTSADGSTAVDGSTATGEPVPTGPEQCNGLDDDGDGLIDEVSAQLQECDGCTLLQGAAQAWWVCPEEQPWADAQTRCETLGATLAVVPDEATQAFLQDALGVGFHWLGARQAEGEGAWSWVDGTPWSYDNWGTTQPDDIAPGQHCLRLTFGIIDGDWFDGAWDDFFCEDPHPVLCSAPHDAS